MQKILSVALALAVVLVFSVGTSSADEQFPMPPDLKITAPGPDVPPGMAAYSGKWRGKWKGRAPFMFIIESVRPDGAVVLVHSWAQYDQWIWAAGYERNRGKISGGKLKFTNEYGEFTQRLRDDGSMLSNFYGLDLASSGVLERVK